MSSFLQDLRFAARTLLKSPGFLLVAVLSLGLGIGANTAIFSLINAVMLRSLPVSHPEQLVLLTDPGASGLSIDTTEHGERSILAYPEFEQLRVHNLLTKNRVFSGIAAAQSATLEVDGESAPGQTAKLRLQLVSGEFFEVLGVQAASGRTFTPAEDQVPGANPVAVISHGFWQRRFGGDAAAIGQTLRIGRSAFRILGVTPEGFRGMLVGSEPDVWLPLTMQAEALPGRDYLHPRDVLWLQVIARLAPRMPRAKAEAGVNVEFQQILQGWAASLPNEKERRNLLDQKILLRPGARGASDLRGQFSDPLLLLMGMVGLVLLIACANIANLMLARATARQREIGVRLALGAARARLIRQLLTESVLVAFLGGAAGGALAGVGTSVLVNLVPGGSDTAVGSYVDWRVLLFTAGVSLLTGIAFGLFPALRATRVDVNRTLGANVRGAGSGRGWQAGRILVVAQVALSLLLVMGATLLVRSLQNLMGQKLGFNRDHLLMVAMNPTAGGYNGAAVPALYQKLRENLLAVPGVRGVTMSNTGLFRGDSGDPISLEGTARRGPDELRSRWTLVGPDYFATLGIPLVRGRQIDAADAAHGSPVCVINEAFARYFFEGGDPIGRHVTDEYPTTRETFEIVGIAADAREHSVSVPDRPRFYGNLLHPIGTIEGVHFLLSTPGDPNSLIANVRQTIAAVDRGLPVSFIRSVNDQIERRLVTNRLIADLSAFFGGLALLMASIGLYGVMSYSMSRRTGEIGIRMALGASQGSVLQMVLRETLLLVTIGTAAGLPCALAAGKLLRGQLFGLSPADPATLGLAVAILLVVTLLAGYIPARRAARVDPISALRCD